MKALVTGGTGFVGSHLVEALRRRDVAVTALARSPAKARPLEALGCRIVTGALADRAALAEAARGHDVVYHVAGLVAARNEAEFLAANRDGTHNLVRAAEDGGVRRFVLVSSMAAGGPSVRGAPGTADAPAAPVTAYGRSKLAAERVVSAASIAWTIVRPPMVYGPRDREVLKVFRIARFGIAPVFGDGRQELSAIHATDLAEALVAAAEAAAVGRTYYACHPETFTSGDFVRTVGDAMGRTVRVVPVPLALGRGLLTATETAARAVGRPTILTRDKANEFFQPAWTGDPSPLTRDTGWEARFDLKSGLADTYRWYQGVGWL